MEGSHELKMLDRTPQRYVVNVDALSAVCKKRGEECANKLKAKYKNAESLCEQAERVVESVPIACYMYYSGMSDVEVQMDGVRATWYGEIRGADMYITNTPPESGGRVRAEVEYFPNELLAVSRTSLWRGNPEGLADSRIISSLVRACDSRLAIPDLHFCRDCVYVALLDEVFQVVEFEPIYEVAGADPFVAPSLCQYFEDHVRMEREDLTLINAGDKVFIVKLFSNLERYLEWDITFVEASVEKLSDGRYYYNWGVNAMRYGFVLHDNVAKGDVVWLMASRVGNAYVVKLGDGYYAIATPYNYTVYRSGEVKYLEVAVPPELYRIFRRAVYKDEEAWVYGGCWYGIGKIGKSYCDRGESLEIMQPEYVVAISSYTPP